MHKFPYQYKSISWLLLAAVLLLFLVPVHMHFHHVDEPASQSHEHKLDLHAALDNTGSSHHEESDILDLDFKGFVKKISNGSLLALFAVLLFFVLSNTLSGHLLRAHANTNPVISPHYISPPLRAPPHV